MHSSRCVVWQCCSFAGGRLCRAPAAALQPAACCICIGQSASGSKPFGIQEVRTSHATRMQAIMKRAPSPMSPLESLASSAVRTAHKVRMAIVLSNALLLQRGSEIKVLRVRSYSFALMLASCQPMLMCRSMDMGLPNGPTPTPKCLNRSLELGETPDPPPPANLTVESACYSAGACGADCGAHPRWLHGTTGGQVPAQHPRPHRRGAGPHDRQPHLDVLRRAAPCLTSPASRLATLLRPTDLWSLLNVSTKPRCQ